MTPTAHQGQDLFAYHYCGLKSGCFLDLGCGDPFIGSNTAWLEHKGWLGYAVDLKAFDYSGRPRTFFQQGNAAQMSMRDVSGDLLPVDFLSIDCDDASLEVLANVMDQGIRPKVICVEHDAYRLGDLLKVPQRTLLFGLGYCLVPMNTDVAGAMVPWEDWWVLP